MIELKLVAFWDGVPVCVTKSAKSLKDRFLFFAI